ncbi:MAG: heme-binding domain-containing protein [Bacteroidales bacterium]|nr:heme-binding domain-containing protein [Bacteroidales bacterium]
MKKGIKLTGWTILVLLIVIQFAPLERENPVTDQNLDFLMATDMPADVQSVFKNSCYDCHSNETIWPWYSYVAPMSFVITHHVEEGRDQLNLSSWGEFDPDDQKGILKHMKKEIEKGEMPLAGYTALHGNAKMTEERKALVIQWIDKALLTLESEKE